MNKLVVLGIVLVTPIEAQAENKGIEETNYTTTLSGSDSDNGNMLALSGIARLPVADYTGISIAGSVAQFNGNDIFLDSSNISADIGIFVRKYDLGIIQANYGYSKLESDAPAGNIKSNIDSYSLNGAYYISRYDISFSRTIVKPENGNIFNYSTIGLSYYTNNNMKFNALMGGMDSDDSYSIGLILQPANFNNSVSISVSYQSTNSYDTLSLSASYYFDTHISLLDRIRRY